MEIQFYNTLSHGVEVFKPVTPGVVRMYHCGPTVYDFAHIGNFRSFLLADVLRRFLESAGYGVRQVMNITDVGHMTEDQLADGGGQDKMELAAERLKAAKKQGRADVENPDDPYQVAGYFTRAFLEDAKRLGMKLADEYPQNMPTATGSIAGMIGLIEKLIERGHAYVAGDGAVYYDVRSFSAYGQLSGNTLEKLQAGAGGRVDAAASHGKRNPHDFLLWKRDPKHLMRWPSPWGDGYPGWHIECSAMAMGTHGVETLDIHTGGEDNIFPHHECEIAQSCGVTGKPFAQYWLHARHLLVEGTKMSKSKGNFYTVRDLLGRGVEPAVLRYELIKTHYRSNANFTEKGLEDSRRAVERLRGFAGQEVAGCLGLGVVPNPCESSNEARVKKDIQPVAPLSGVEGEFLAALADDLNISEALGVLFKWMNATPSPTLEDRAAAWRVNQVLGVLEANAGVSAAGDAAINQRCRELDEARAIKDYARADAIRQELAAADIEVQTGPSGTTWKRKIRLGT